MMNGLWLLHCQNLEKHICICPLINLFCIYAHNFSQSKHQEKKSGWSCESVYTLMGLWIRMGASAGDSKPKHQQLLVWRLSFFNIYFLRYYQMHSGDNMNEKCRLQISQSYLPHMVMSAQLPEQSNIQNMAIYDKYSNYVHTKYSCIAINYVCQFLNIQQIKYK